MTISKYLEMCRTWCSMSVAGLSVTPGELPFDPGNFYCQYVLRCHLGKIVELHRKKKNFTEMNLCFSQFQRMRKKQLLEPCRVLKESLGIVMDLKKHQPGNDTPVNQR